MPSIRNNSYGMTVKRLFSLSDIIAKTCNKLLIYKLDFLI
jgi:hypothetical protein